MDKRFLDPRRPKGALTADEKLEMLPAYAEELPFTPSLYASHKEAIEGLKSKLALMAHGALTVIFFNYISSSDNHNIRLFPQILILLRELVKLKLEAYAVSMLFAPGQP